MPSLATFNANNLFLRYKFKTTYPGDRSRKSEVEATEVGVKRYLPGKLPFGVAPKSTFVVWDAGRRNLLARALKAKDGRLPDIVCFQEVENIEALRILSDRYLDGRYKYSLLIDGHDTRNIDVGILSRFPIRTVRSNVDERSGGSYVFSRDCLEAEIELPRGRPLILLVNHFKSKYVRNKNDVEDVRKSHRRRRAQAKWVKEYVSRRFRGEHNSALYAVVGDFNDTPVSPYVRDLVSSRNLTDVVAAHRDADDCWTYYWRNRNRVSQIDYVLASKALTRRIARVVRKNGNRRPHIERRGLGFKRISSVSGEILPRETNLVHFETDVATTRVPRNALTNEKLPFQFDRFDEVEEDLNRNISDHCPVKVWF